MHRPLKRWTPPSWRKNLVPQFGITNSMQAVGSRLAASTPLRTLPHSDKRLWRRSGRVPAYKHQSLHVPTLRDTSTSNTLVRHSALSKGTTGGWGFMDSAPPLVFWRPDRASQCLILARSPSIQTLRLLQSQFAFCSFTSWRQLSSLPHTIQQIADAVDSTALRDWGSCAIYVTRSPRAILCTHNTERSKYDSISEIHG